MLNSAKILYAQKKIIIYSDDGII